MSSHRGEMPQQGIKGHPIDRVYIETRKPSPPDHGWLAEVEFSKNMGHFIWFGLQEYFDTELELLSDMQTNYGLSLLS